ncbi:MAG: hypothetical protein LBD04_09810 [Synergistaceae bacterium]|jgi:hypothetical protein|nr:hypothetical protein [Synergistaceae bacterium]
MLFLRGVVTRVAKLWDNALYFLERSSFPPSTLYLFFPFVHDAPSTRFFLKIAESLQAFSPLIVFTGVSRNEALRAAFDRYGTTLVMMRTFTPREFQKQAWHMTRLLRTLQGTERAFVLGVASKAFYRTVLPNKREEMSCWDVLPWPYPLSPMDHALYLDGRVVLDEAVSAALSPQEKTNVHVVAGSRLGEFLYEAATKFFAKEVKEVKL